MNGIFSLAWFYWDPSREIFSIPVINRPLGWYGVCFVLGFILGYFVIIPIFKRKLLETKNFLPRDIKSWSSLARDFKAAQNTNPFYQKLNAEAKKQLAQQHYMQEPSPQLKANLLQTLNESSLSRGEIEALFPQSIFSLKEISSYLADRITWFVTIGTLVGARLGEVFFYDWPHYRAHPLDIFKIWEGGLASHGGTLGILLALVLFKKSIQRNFPEFTFLAILDCLCIPAALGSTFIRIGNFFNQEIVGIPTDVPWAVIFGHPVFGDAVVPRHPVQLYEAAAYFTIFVSLYCLWKFFPKKLREGYLIGLFFITTFFSRFLIEFFKSPLNNNLDESFLQTGQYLSIPFILGGAAILLYASRKTPKFISIVPKSYL